MKKHPEFVAGLLLVLLVAGCATPPSPPLKTCAELNGTICPVNFTCTAGTLNAKTAGICCIRECIPPKTMVTDYNVGSEIEIQPGQTITVNGIRYVDRIVETQEKNPAAPNEQIFALVDMTFINNSGATITLNDKVASFILTDENKYAYSADIASQAALYNPLIPPSAGNANQIFDGLSRRGEVPFQIKKNARNLVLNIVAKNGLKRFNVALLTAPDPNEFNQAIKEILQGEIGQEIVGEDIKLTLNGARYVKTVDEKDSDSSFAETQKGLMYAIVSVTAQNISGGPLDLSKAFSVLLKDAQDYSYKKDDAGTNALVKPFNTGQIATNDPITGEMAFNIPIVTNGPYASITFAKGKKLYQIPLPAINQPSMLAQENALPTCQLTIDNVFFTQGSDSNHAIAQQVETTLKNTGKNRFSATWDLTINNPSTVVSRIPSFRNVAGRFRVGRSLKENFSLSYNFLKGLAYSIKIDVRDGDKPDIICTAAKNVTV